MPAILVLRCDGLRWHGSMIVRQDMTLLSARAQSPRPAGFAEWESTVPASFKRDPIWRTPAYRYGLWLANLAKADVRTLCANRWSLNNADQLLRAVEGISSNLAEGYGRARAANERGTTTTLRRRRARSRLVLQGGRRARRRSNGAASRSIGSNHSNSHCNCPARTREQIAPATRKDSQ